MATKYVVIVAGGQGLRMKSATPKQFIEIDGIPVIVHTILRFIEYDPNSQIIVAIPKDHRSIWEEIANKHLKGKSNIITVHGGETRFQSVRNAIEKIEDGDGTVAIHDAVRPCITIEDIGKTFNSAISKGSGILVTPLNESIRELKSSKDSIARDRANYRSVQTPQTFKVSIIKEAYNQIYDPTFTDDASVVESAGYRIELIEGSDQNIKITRPKDLELAKILLRK